MALRFGNVQVFSRHVSDIGQFPKANHFRPLRIARIGEYDPPKHESRDDNRGPDHPG